MNSNFDLKMRIFPLFFPDRNSAVARKDEKCWEWHAFLRPIPFLLPFDAFLCSRSSHLLHAQGARVISFLSLVRGPPDMMSASEGGVGSWKSEHTIGRLREFYTANQIQMQAIEGGGQKNAKILRISYLLAPLVKGILGSWSNLTLPLWVDFKTSALRSAYSFPEQHRGHSVAPLLLFFHS